MQVHKRIIIFVIIAVCFFSYFNTLLSLFVWDDALLIRGNPYIRSFKFLPLFFTQDIWNIGPQNEPSGYYRPFLALSFMFDYQLWKNKPFGYHLTNLILHTLVCLLIFVMVQKLCQNKTVAFLSTLLFAAHPVHTESVSFISGRVDFICLAFMLISLLLFLKYFSTKKLILYLFSLLSFLVALLTKEMAVVFPVLVIGMDYFCLSRQKIKALIKNNLFLHLGFFLIIALYIILRSIFIGWQFMEHKSLSFSNFFYGRGPFWRFFTVLKITAYYLRMLFFPYGLNADHIFPPANSLFETPVIAGLILVLFLGYLALKQAKKNPILAFSIFWFFITYFPVSNIIPSGNIFAERFMYIPSVGFCIAVAFGFVKLSQKQVKTSYFNWQKSIFLVFALLILVFMRVTFERNKVWRNEFTLWYETIRSSPESGRAHLNLGNAYDNINSLDKALEEFNAVLHSSINPLWYNYVFNNSAIVYLKKGMVDEAIKSLKISLDLAPEAAMAYNNLATAYGRKGEFKESVRAALTALEKNPYFYFARYNLALGYANLGLVKEAINEYEKFLDIVPADINARLQLGHLYYKEGNFEKARQEWQEALKISKGNQVVKDALKLLENK